MTTFDPSNDLIIDGVIHGYNFDESNFRNSISRSYGESSYGMIYATGDESRISLEQYMRDWSIEELAELVFSESETDVAVYHGLPLDGYFYDGLSSNAKGIEMARRWPHRVLFYGALNPLADDAVQRAEELVVEGGAIGIKFYPENYNGGPVAEPMRLTDPGCERVLEKAIELGVPVAIHKFAPGGHGVSDNYRVGDVEAAAARYPELQFEVVHTGLAFLEETSFMLARYPNVWANLEGTVALGVKFKRRFAEAMGALMGSGAADRIIYATGASLNHPQLTIDAVKEFRMPDDLVEGYGLPQVTPEIISGILGNNFARLHGLDVPKIKAAIADDEFAQRRKTQLGQRWAFI